MTRCLFNLGGAASLLLLLAVLVLWPVSYSYSFGLHRFDGRGAERVVGMERGRLGAIIDSRRLPRRPAGWSWRAQPPSSSATAWRYAAWRISTAPNGDLSWERAGIWYLRLTGSIGPTGSKAGGGARWLIVPCSYVALLLSLTPAAWLRSWRHRRARLRIPAACRSCGYNLTGNVSGVCPECGAPVRFEHRSGRAT